MTFALKELTRLLSPSSVVLGSVVQVSGAVLRVATTQGAMTVRTLESLNVGDRVQISNGLATQAPVAQQTFPV